jgi:hypothetical protein
MPACHRSAGNGSETHREPTRLVTKIAKSVLTPGAPIAAELTIYNGDRYNLYVNKRMAVTPDLPPIFGGEVMLEVREVLSGRVSPFRCSLDRLDEGEAKDHVVLAPGQAVSATVSTDCYDTRTPGRYAVVFRYLDTDRAHMADAIHLTKALVSEPVVIDVVAGADAVPPSRNRDLPSGQSAI